MRSYFETLNIDIPSERGAMAKHTKGGEVSRILSAYSMDFGIPLDL